MNVQGTHSGEEVTVVFSATTSPDSYGVPGSPTWDSVNPDTIEITTLQILDVHVDIDKLPTDLAEAIRSLWNEVEFENAD